MVPIYNRRNFLQQITLTTAGFLVKDFIFPTPVNANETSDIGEKYLVSLPYLTARAGGSQTITLYSGTSYTLTIPHGIKDNTTIVKDGFEFDVRTLYDPESKIGDKIFTEIEKTNLISVSSKTKCKYLYELIEDCQVVDDVSTLELLDYIVSTSELEDNIQQRYKIASNSSRWAKISQVIDENLERSLQSPEDKALLRGTIESIKAGQPIPDFQALKQLDPIVLNSKLEEAFKHTYTYGSIFSRASTVNYLILQSIDSSVRLDDTIRQQLRSTYQQVKEGNKDIDSVALEQLDVFIYKTSNLPANAQLVYKEARNRSLNADENLSDSITSVVDRGQDFKDKKDTAYQNGSAIVPATTKLLSLIGVEAGTGVSISALTGAAATNATLAWLGGGSVAAGGLGMLGGLTIATGGAALIGAAGIVSFELLTQMDREDFKNLGIAVGGGTVLAGGVTFLAWTAATGVTGSLSGAAAITTTMTALGGLSVMTGGTAAIALGGAYAIWSLLDGSKKRRQEILEELETKIYILAEVPAADSLAGLITSKINSGYQLAEVFSAPSLPLNLLANAHKTWLQPDDKETVIALIDTSIWNDAKKGIAFTGERIVWKDTSLSPESLSYPEFANILNSQGLAMFKDEQSRNNLEKLNSIMNLFTNEDDKQLFSDLLRQVGERCMAMTAQKSVVL